MTYIDFEEQCREAEWREQTESRPGEHQAWVYHVVHAGDRIAQKHFGEAGWPVMFRFSDTDPYSDSLFYERALEETDGSDDSTP